MPDATNPEALLLRQMAITELGLLDPGADKIIDQIVCLARALVDAPIATLSVIDGDSLFFTASEGLDEQKIPLETAFSRYVIEGDRLLEVTDANLDVRFKDAPFLVGSHHIRSYTGCPVHAPNGVVIGALCVLDFEPRKLNLQQLEQIEALGGLLEENLRLRSHSLLDSLTGLYNRRFLEQTLAREWQRANRQQLPVSVLMVDIDHFKVFNDTYGHFAGDTCLLQVSELLHTMVNRPSDMLVRFGGEEFLILLPETDFAGMELVANNILRTVRAAAIPHRKAPRGHLTVSIGGATIKPDALSRVSAEDLLKAADGCLYGAKTTGRNKAYFTRVD